MKRIVVAALVGVVISTASYAGHSWSSYHWARTSNPLNLAIVNSTTGDWVGHVTQAVTYWNESGVLNMVEEDGNTANRTRRRCKAPGGKVRVCNLAYGNNGWLGLAGISLDSAGHITSGYTKLNDTYFTTGSYYSSAEWKQSVTCQELGHNVGLAHQDEIFNNTSLKSCMDYQDPPYQYPNDHDYAQLEAIYSSHTEDASDDGGGGGGGCNAPQGKGCNKGKANGHNGEIGWGMSLGRHGQTESFMRIDPDGTRHITYVTWVEGH